MVAILLLWLFWRRRGAKKKVEEKRRQAYDNDPRLQGIDANRAGDTFGRIGGKFYESFRSRFSSCVTPGYGATLCITSHAE